MNLARLAGGTLHEPAGAPAPVGFAARELAGYLRRIFGSGPGRLMHTAPSGAWLCLTPPGAAPPRQALAVPAGAEYVVRPADDALVLAATSPRGLLAAVYAVLAAVGCQWSAHGAGDEHVPDGGGARREVAAIEARPPFARRVYAADLATWHYSMPDRLEERLPADLAFVDWMAKSGATGLLFIRHANDTQWTIPELIGPLGARGLEVEGGGHALVELLPRALFARHPEYFPAGPDGVRSEYGNLCVSSPRALATVRAEATAALAAIPGMRGLHVWGLDLMAGGWCGCAGCHDLTPSDQALRTANAVADALDPARIWHLAYHDTLAPPERERPHPGVWAEFAPRERCYAHALDDPACATNLPYRRALDRHLELFEGRVDVFEYYGDAILFGGLAVPLTRVIAGDLAAYARAGVQGVSCLTFGTYSLAAHGVNLETFARGTLDPAAARDGLATYCAGRYGAAAGPMARYLTALEAVLGRVVTYGDVLAPPRREPVRDALEAAVGDAARLGTLLAAAGDSRATACDRALLDYTLGALDALSRWAEEGGGPEAAARAVAALARAADPLRSLGPEVVGTWGRYDLELTQHYYAAALSR